MASAADRTGGNRLTVLGSVALIGVLGLACLALASRQQIDVAFSEGVEGALHRNVSTDSRLPALASRPGRTAPVERVEFPESATDPEPSPVPGDEVSGSGTPSEPPDAGASPPGPLLDARLTEIASQASALREEYQAFAVICQPTSSGDKPSSDWVAGLKRGPDAGADPERLRTLGTDCTQFWNGLKGRLDELVAALAGVKESATGSGVSTEDWQKALASHEIQALAAP